MNHKYTQEKEVGKWKVFVSPSTNYGYFENQFNGVEGSLDFLGKKVIDFDGVSELPKAVIIALLSLNKSFDKHILPTQMKSVDFEYKVSSFRTAGLSARWVKLINGAPIIQVSLPDSDIPTQRKWWYVDDKMYQEMRIFGIMNGFHNLTMLSDIFSI